ncbi:GSCFA domain-containing protein [Rubrivivax albus]|uniref:GSCFA domain-containing protein n=1 Tax=Rubrivivax albus TaxID=2499835 RepID=A0A3S2TKT5_9BURK|nr:GSCFA domain-containing protein [Rubrivivax albus]RVT49481.1 GSCFA domain-containing protein [Rubrivivax albus]
MSHPYADGESHQFWNRAMSAVAPGHVDPVTARLHIGPQERVATLGSCFAQHIARHLQRSGCTYHVTEPAPPGLAPEAAQARQYGLFSARYGNVYTVRQALQLFDRAFGRFQPRAQAWARGSRFVDPFRPQVEPEGFASEAEVQQAREAHLACVRTLFETSEWLVFTLGLTEAWRDREDGAVFPLAPGVAGGRYDPAQTEFVNFDVDAVRSDLATLVERVQDVNPGCRWVLTVSPVPLAATFEPRHVWVSTAASKAVLRVAADEAERRFGHVHYFPSYEVITSPAAGNRYYADDLRQVTDIGVQHVMRLFSRHCLQPAGDDTAPGMAPAALHLPDAPDVVCDEEAITAAMNALGPRGAR